MMSSYGGSEKTDQQDPSDLSEECGQFEYYIRHMEVKSIGKRSVILFFD